MSFEERLLVEIKNEFVTRRAARKRRLAFGGAVAAAAAAAAIIVPIVITPDPAYAVTRNSDGSIQITIKEFRDADGLERELAGLGVRADITYLQAGMACEHNRYQDVGAVNLTREEMKSLLKDKDPKVQAKVEREMAQRLSERAIQVKNGVVIHPDMLSPGQTVVLEVMENTGASPESDTPQVLSSVTKGVAAGVVKPCVQVPQSGWNDVGDPSKNPEAFPPAGS
ncbi:hypothetical protein ACIBO5_47400 [Nonomuraea angiospora]|uniref:hypothetical protein n=1 Tax=Nonomuraea angiospora TaxID=46172 RepID=UPI0029B8E69A|nr:hypothetical protein [Nonomuraea angiospora]MDX3103331.1 hypothetical protein [Nonomuraea angiospora]